MKLSYNESMYLKRYLNLHPDIILSRKLLDNIFRQNDYARIIISHFFIDNLEEELSNDSPEPKDSL